MQQPSNFNKITHNLLTSLYSNCHTIFNIYNIIYLCTWSKRVLDEGEVARRDPAGAGAGAGAGGARVVQHHQPLTASLTHSCSRVQ